MNLLGGLALLLLIGAGVVVLLVGAIAAVKKDTSHGTSGSLSSAALEVQSLLEPGVKHRIEAEKDLDELEDEDASGNR